MTNAELIKALRYCADEDKICTEQTNCGYYGKGFFCQDVLMRDAADALEAADNRIAELESNNPIVESVLVDKLNQRIDELEAQLPKEGEGEAKKPKTVKETEYSFYCDCPTCRGRLISNVDGEWCAGSFDRFCRMCGQKIDWSEYCGWSNKPNCGAKMDGKEQNK